MFRNIKSPCPIKLSDSRLLEMLIFYNENASERVDIAKQAFETEEYSGYTRYGFTEQYLERNYF